MFRHLRTALAPAAAVVVLLMPDSGISQSRQRGQAAARAAAVPTIPFQKFVLDNGLTLIVHEDRKAPIVAVNVWYHVGAKNERPGRSGFAHLFEHLMFNGSEHYNDDYFKALERVGATNLNGTTDLDRTNYFQNVPSSALDLALFMESDRMGHLIGVVNQARLDEQRGVVQNEKRQGENQPYGKAWDTIIEQTYPANHPYSRGVIGSMEDLNAAKLEDVHEWFRTYYGPSNAVLVVAGDVDARSVKAKVERYFGHIPAGPPVARPEQWIAKMTGVRRARMQDRVAAARIYKVWNVPGWGTPTLDHLDLASDVLAAGKSSRLYKRLVYDAQLATEVSAFILDGELGGQFYIVATARPGADVAAMERAIDEEVARFLAAGPTAAELERVKMQSRASFIRGMERIGGFGGKSDILATNEVYAKDPGFYKVRLERMARATPGDVHRAAREWLSDGMYALEVLPFPDYRAGAPQVDRAKLPEPGATAAPKFPTTRTATLANGMRVVLAERRAVPVVNLALVVDAGYSTDPLTRSGQASLAMNAMDEGTTTRSSLQISETLQRLGATLGTWATLDASGVTMSTLRESVDSSLTLFADVVLRPAFPAADVERLRKEQVARIQREKVNPAQMGQRIMPRLLYGEGHAYSGPFTGSGFERSVASLTRAQLVEYHRTWFKPNNATLVVVGDVSLDELLPKLEQLFRGWERGPVPTRNIATVPQPAGSRVYLVDRPGSQQSIIFAGHLAPPKRNDGEIAIEALNRALGGSFTSRINLNLREDKHWSYGAFSVLTNARGQRPFYVYAPVQTDKTKESLAEVAKELRDIVQARPIAADELAKVQASLTLSLPGRWETNSAVVNSITELVQFGLPLDFYDGYAAQVKALTVADLAAAARQTVLPQHVVWVVVGDRAKIEEGIRSLGLGELHLLDADGVPAQLAAER